jgi:outer membrane receptor protein involved in Fe transport
MTGTKSKFLLFFTSILLTSSILFAQEKGDGNKGGGTGHPGGTGAYGAGSGILGSLKGVVINSTSLKPLEYAYVVLYKAMDSTLVSGSITDSLGKYKIEKIALGKYYVAVNLIGHKQQKISDIFIGPKNPDKTLDTIKLDANSNTLNTYEVKDKKQDVEYTLDKKVINVEKNLVSTGGTAVDVMQTIPSVTVDIDGNLSMKGSTNITVLVDGKPSGLTGASRSAVLEQIPASSIESIEIISNPSAKYDPDGMSGIINIILKKKKERGYHGTFTVNAGTGDKYNGSVSLNYSKNKFNVFTSYDVRSNHNKGWGDMQRQTILNDTASYLNNHSTSSRKGISHNIKLGTDFYMNDKNSFTISGILGLSSDTHSDFTTSRALDMNSVLTSYYENSSSEPNKGQDFDYALDYKHSFKKKSEYLTADATYSTSKETETQDQSVQYYYSDLITPYNFPLVQHTLSDNKDNVTTIQTDYSLPISKKSKFETGAKSIIRSMDNDYIFQNFSDSLQQFVNDTNYSNHFIYNEQIHAVYATYSNTIGAFEFQAGLRAEQALTKSTQKTQNTEFDKNYFSLFPTLHLNLNLKNDNSLQLSYSRRVNRPNYWMLNPFKEFMSPGIYRTGNPYLTPEYIDSYELGHMKYWDKTSLNSSIFYKQINDAIQRFTTIDSNGIQMMTQKNISTGTSYGLEFVVSQEFTTWWKANATFSYFKTVMKGTTDGTELTNSNYSWTAKLNSTLTVLKNLDAQITANYRAPMVTIQGSMKANYSADIAMKKEIFKNASLTLRLSDIFNTQKFVMESSGSNFILNNTRKRESRVLYLGFTYKINGGQKGKDKKKFDNSNDVPDTNDF